MGAATYHSINETIIFVGFHIVHSFIHFSMNTLHAKNVLYTLIYYTLMNDRYLKSKSDFSHINIKNKYNI